MPLSVNDSLTQNYADYYDSEEGLLEWRKLGAADKCANIVRLCSSLPHDSVLDIGCGEGAILQRLSELRFGRRLVGLEISPSALRHAAAKNIPNAEFHLFDGYQLPHNDQHFDLAILSHVIEHVEYPRKLIYEAARVARHVFVEVPLEDHSRVSGDFVFDHVGHINFYNPRTIRGLVRSCGMRILDGLLSHSSPASYVFRKGRLKGHLSFMLKEAVLACLPAAAPHLFTYHYSLTYTQDSPPEHAADPR